MDKPSIAELTREFVELNQHVKGRTATEEQTSRWHELRRMLLVAQRQPVPETPPVARAAGP